MRIVPISRPFFSKETHMTARITVPLLALMVALAFTSTANAAGVDGTWKSTYKGQDGKERTSTYKFKQDGDKVTGTVSGRDNTETSIEDGKIKDGTLSFAVTREFNGNKVTMKYEGKVEGDTIKGTRETPGRNGGEARKRDWTATREK